MPPTTPSSGQPSTGASPSVAQVPPPPAPSTVPLTIGNLHIHKLVTKNSLRAKSVLSKLERLKLGQNDKMTLIHYVTKHRGAKDTIKAPPNSITHPKQLDDSNIWISLSIILPPILNTMMLLTFSISFFPTLMATYRETSRKPFFQWRPPEGNETKRVIFTKDHGERVHVWNSSTKRWTSEETPAASAANVVTVPPATVASTLTNAVTAPASVTDGLSESKLPTSSTRLEFCRSGPLQWIILLISLKLQPLSLSVLITGDRSFKI
jgi:hypothetical protein